ncbi:MAG: ROK family protein [Parasporobacterium sp.]|nr:ROK family protein [Parasporobacterium sp.]
MKYRIGADIGGTGIKVGIVDENHAIVRRTSLKTPGTFEESMEALRDMVSELAEQVGIKVSDLASVGVGAPSTVNPKTGRLVFSNNTNWKDVPIMDVLRSLFPIPVYFGNDADCAVIGETLAGAARGRKHVLMITLGTGVGGGIIIEGKLFCGGDRQGAEIGHTPLIYNGKQCSCGIKGCLEAYASATALIEQTAEAISAHPESAMAAWVKENGEINGKTAFECAKSGDETAIAVVEQYTSYVAAGLGGFINTFRPDLIIIGGGVSRAGDYLLDKIRSHLPESTYAIDILGAPELKTAMLGNDAGIIGAAFLDQM